MSALNMSSILKIVKRRLGVSTFTLPFNDDELADIIEEESLPLFSVYFPNLMTIKMNFANFKVPGESETYYIDRSFLGEDTTIIGIENIYINDLCNAYQNYAMPIPAYEMFTDLQIGSGFESMLAVPLTFYYMEPDKVKIESAPYGFGEAHVELSLVHPRNLSTIKLVYKEELLKIILCDIKIALYENLKRTDKISTTFEQIDLKIDDWQNAYSEKNTLLDQWDELYLNTRHKKIYRI